VKGVSSAFIITPGKQFRYRPFNKRTCIKKNKKIVQLTKLTGRMNYMYILQNKEIY